MEFSLLRDQSTAVPATNGFEECVVSLVTEEEDKKTSLSVSSLTEDDTLCSGLGSYQFSASLNRSASWMSEEKTTCRLGYVLFHAPMASAKTDLGARPSAKALYSLFSWMNRCF